MDIWVSERARAGRVWAWALLIGVVDGALLGGFVWTVSCLWSPSPWTAMLWIPGLMMAIPVGAAVGLPTGVVTGTVLAVAQARSRDGLRRAHARALAGPTAGLVVLAFALLDPGSLRYVVVAVLPAAAVTAGVAALLAPLIVAPRWRAVSARPTDAAAAAGTASPGWSRAPGR